MSRLGAKLDEFVVPQLYLFVHFHLYHATSCLLRSHLSECLGSIRKAIDAGLSAYKIILEPSSGEQYVKRDRAFRYIKTTVEEAIKQDATKFPLAAGFLLDMHEKCSQIGSHADVTSFIHRMAIQKPTTTQSGEMQVYYFQFPKEKTEYRLYFLGSLKVFLRLFQIFKIHFDRELRIIDPKWEETIEKLGPTLNQRSAACREQLRRAGESGEWPA